MNKRGNEKDSLEGLLAQNLGTMQKFRLMASPEEEDKCIEIKNFTPSDEIMDLVAIDGSYSFILNLSSMWLAFVRVGALHYRFSDENGYELLDSRAIERPVLVSTRSDIMAQMGDMYKKLYEATLYASEQHREMVNQVRRLLEQELAYDMAVEKKNVILAMDGTLTPLKGTDFLRKAVSICDAHDNILIGVSKDSFTHAFRSYRTDEEVLSKRDFGGMGYVAAPLAKTNRKNSLLYDKMLGDVYFAKLHFDSGKWFRIDVGTFKQEPHRIFGHLAHYAKSRLCLGYIYPLLEAHRFVVTVRHFHHVYEDMVLAMAGDFELNLEEAVNGLTHLEGTRRGAFHEYLDSVSREV
ncbi:MAG: DNA double-strand break repair nuclease NurA [Thermoplasmata archaeon]|nr:MAG: DNA double-strand break repair nuclease NurA [Thermoplasmata archaeon]